MCVSMIMIGYLLGDIYGLFQVLQTIVMRNLVLLPVGLVVVFMSRHVMINNLTKRIIFNNLMIRLTFAWAHALKENIMIQQLNQCAIAQINIPEFLLMMNSFSFILLAPYSLYLHRRFRRTFLYWL